MKKRSLFLLVLILILPLASAVEIGEIFTIQKDKPIIEKEDKTTTYFYAGSKLIASKNNDEIKYQYQDRLNSDINTKTLPFGQEINSDERFSFTGKELDNSGLYYFNARYYDANIGRFTSIDPYTGVDGNLAYAYVANNPMNYVDPTGSLAELPFHLGLKAHKEGRFEEYERIRSQSGVEGAKMLGDYFTGEVTFGGYDLFSAIFNKDLYGEELGTINRILAVFAVIPFVPRLRIKSVLADFKLTRYSIGDKELKRMVHNGRVDPRIKESVSEAGRGVQIRTHSEDSECIFLSDTPFYSFTASSGEELRVFERGMIETASENGERIYKIELMPGTAEGYHTGRMVNTLEEATEIGYSASFIENEFLVRGGYGSNAKVYDYDFETQAWNEIPINP